MGGNFNPINPNYYNDTRIEPIQVIEDWGLGFCLGSAMKYMKRAGKKDGNSRLQDLKKIKWYIEREISNEERRVNDERHAERKKIF